MGTLAGVLLLATGVAMLLNFRSTWALAQATAYVSVPTFVTIGIITQIAGWGITLLGIVYPLAIVFFLRKSATAARA